MDCKTARLLLEIAGPRRAHELAAEDLGALEGHLHDCLDCAAHAQAERQIDAVLGRAMRDVPVPGGLRHRLLEQLEAESAARLRRRARRWLAVAAAAALAGLAVWLGLDSWRSHHRPRIDFEAVAQNFAAQRINPTPENVEQWFAYVKNIRTQAPAEFNYALLSYYDTTELQGRTVPLLLFAQGKEQAWVYIVADRDFKIQDALQNQPNVGSSCKVEMRAAADPHFAYLIVYTSESLAPFTDNPPPPS